MMLTSIVLLPYIRVATDRQTTDNISIVLSQYTQSLVKFGDHKTDAKRYEPNFNCFVTIHSRRDREADDGQHDSRFVGIDT